MIRSCNRCGCVPSRGRFLFGRMDDPKSLCGQCFEETDCGEDLFLDWGSTPRDVWLSAIKPGTQ